MIVYEVNIDIAAALYLEYYAWLIVHIEEMLCIPGFERAEIGVVEQTDKSKSVLRVSYTVQDREALQSYFDHHAEKMRKASIEQWAAHVSIQRRVILNIITIPVN